jgi:hypothetical protein
VFWQNVKVRMIVKKLGRWQDTLRCVQVKLHRSCYFRSFGCNMHQDYIMEMHGKTGFLRLHGGIMNQLWHCTMASSDVL